MYDIGFSTRAAKCYLKLDENLRKMIDTKLTIIARDPYASHNNVKPLKGQKSCYRLRVGNWRIVYEIVNKQLTIYVIKIGQRKEVYEK